MAAEGGAQFGGDKAPVEREGRSEGKRGEGNRLRGRWWYRCPKMEVSSGEKASTGFEGSSEWVWR